MSLAVANLGWWKANKEYAHSPHQVVLPTSVGTTIVVIADSNAPQPFAQNNSYGDGTGQDVIRVFEINSTFTSSIEVATIAVANLETPFNLISADLYEDNSVGIAYRRANADIQYRKVTYGSWAVSAAEFVSSPGFAGTGVKELTLTISQGDTPIISIIDVADNNPKAVIRNYGRSSAGVWSQGPSITLMTTADPNSPMLALSTQFTRAGTSGARPLLIMASSAQRSGTDHGFRIWSAVVDENTGGIGAITLRKTYLAGDMTTGWGSQVRTGYLFAAGGSEVVCALMQAADKSNLLVSKLSWTGGSFSEIIPAQQSKAGFNGINKAYQFAASYRDGSVNFYYGADFAGANASPINYIARIDSVAKSVRFSGYYRWDDMQNNGQDQMYPMAGTGKWAYLATSQHPMVFFRVNGNELWSMRAHKAFGGIAYQVTPANGSQAPSATPEVSLRATLIKKWPQSRYKAVWQFATDAGFTTNVRTFIQPDEKFATIENTHISGSYAYFVDVLPQNLTLTSGTWFVRGALTDEFGIIWLYSGTNSFTLLHPPSAINLLPDNGAVIDSNFVDFSWKFTDPSPTDVQTAFQIIVELNETGQVIYDSDKVPSALGTHVTTIDEQYASVLLRWKIRLWDGDDQPGEYSTYRTFMVAGPPSVVIDSPLDGSTAASATPEIRFTPTVAPNRRIVKFQVTVLNTDGTIHEDSGVVSTDVGTGTQLAWRPSRMMEDNGSYTVRVTVGDQTGLLSELDEVSFSVDYVAAPSSTDVFVSSDNYNTDGLAYVELQWADTRDPDFTGWQVERQIGVLAMDGFTVLSVDEWEVLDIVTTASSGTQTYWDFYAPSGYQVSYRVRQLVDRNGDKGISFNDPVVTTVPRSDGYWLIAPDDVITLVEAYRLSNVIADDYTDEYEETEYSVVGRGRHVDRGDYLGVSGSLTCQLRDTHNKSARQKRLEIEGLKKLNKMLYIRTPFGDVWPVSVGNMGVGRIAGVGPHEFVDLSLPYSQVMSE